MVVLVGLLVDLIARYERVGFILFGGLLLFVLARHLQVEHRQLPGERIQVVHIRRIIWNMCLVIMSHRRVEALIVT